MNDQLNRLVIEPFGHLLDRLWDFLPNLFFALSIFVAGILLAYIIKYAVSGIARLAGIDRRSEKWGLQEQLHKWGAAGNFSDIIGGIAFWLLVLYFIILALNALDVVELNMLLSKFFLFLPNLFIGLIILFIGYLFSNFLAKATLVWAVNSGLKMARIISRFVQMLSMLLALTMALEQLGIGRAAILIVFTVLFGGVVLGFSIAFGLGGRGVAKNFLERHLKDERRDEIEHL